MQTIEFVGIARSGKTTTAKYLEKEYKNVVFHPEKHLLVPKSLWKDNYKHNLWYANYLIDELKKSLEDPKIHIFERGIVDRVIIGNTYYGMGWISKKQWDEFNTLLNPWIEKIDKVFVFLIPVEESVKRAEALEKDVKRAVPYMNLLYKEYIKLKDWFPRTVYLSENAIPEKLQNITSENIFG